MILRKAYQCVTWEAYMLVKAPDIRVKAAYVLVKSSYMLLKSSYMLVEAAHMLVKVRGLQVQASCLPDEPREWLEKRSLALYPS